MERRVAIGFGFAVMVALAGLVSLSSLRYVAAVFGMWVAVDPRIRSVIGAHPIAAFSHVLIAPIPLVVGPLQFMPWLRQRHLNVHRWLGRTYLLACSVAGAGGLATSFHASGGPAAGFGFGLLAVLWVATTLAAWAAAAARDIPLHRLLMRFSYAMTFGAVTLRLQIPFGPILGFKTYSDMSVWLAYTAWIPNVIVVALYSWQRNPGLFLSREQADGPATDL